MNTTTAFPLRDPVSPVRLKIAMGGDFCPGPHGSRLAREGRGAEVLSALAPFLSDADVRMVQFETPLPAVEAPIPKTGPNLVSSPETADILRGIFDVALLANNHVGDHGPQGALDTLRELAARGIRTVGAGASLDEAAAPLRLEARGRAVSIFDFAEFEFGITDGAMAGAAPQRPLADLRAVADEAAAGRTVVVVLHGGHEFHPFPSPRLRDLCRAFAEAGASFVANCHEHCPQGVEWHRGVPIVYCPGNLWFPPRDPAGADDRPALWNYGALAKVSFDDRGPFALELLPYRSDADRVTPLDGAPREAFLSYVRRLSEPIPDTAALRAWFEAWSAESGRTYLRDAASALPADWLGDRAPRDWQRGAADPRPFLPMRNLFTCEAHHDLVRTYLRLAVEGRLPEASHLQAGIAALQNPPFALPPGLPPVPVSPEERARTLDLFARSAFGVRPPAAERPACSFAKISPDVPAMGGRAVRVRARVSYGGPGGNGGFDILAFLPAGASPVRPVPAFLLLCNRDSGENMDPDRVARTPFWDAERIVERGYAAVALHIGSVLPDDDDGFAGGLQSIFLAPGETKTPESWATLSAWAWCGSRAMDWIETEPRIRRDRVAVVGHSRGGKTALWCAATDPRFAMAVSNCSGCGGAKLNRVRLPQSESIADLVRGFPHWFCGAYARWAGRDRTLPFDQHQLLALVAPRLLYVSSATLDPWAGQPGEFLAAQAASAAWRALGSEGIPADAVFPLPGKRVSGGRVGYHVRPGYHTIERSDWDHWIDFAEENGWQGAAHGARRDAGAAEETAEARR